jgi:hypothetical protein
MAEHVMTVLRAKRKQIADQIHDTEKKLRKMRAAVANLDATMNLLIPDHPEFIAPPKNRTRYFALNELSRMVRDMLREAGQPITAGEVTRTIMAAKGFPEDHYLAVTKMVVARLGAFARSGAVVKTGKTRDAQWALAPEIETE